MKYLKYIDVTRAMFPDQPLTGTENVSAPWTPITKPLSESRVALISSGGIYRKDQPLSPDKNDLTFRRFRDTDAGDLRSATTTTTTVTPKRRQLRLPIERMRSSRRMIHRKPSEVHFTFMGRIFRKTQL